MYRFLSVKASVGVEATGVQKRLCVKVPVTTLPRVKVSVLKKVLCVKATG